MTDDTAPMPRRSGSALVHETLRNEIIDLTLPPGTAIDETQIATRFSLSRTPVREAMVRLAADGLITVLPNRATIVAPIDFTRLPQFFDALTLMYRVTMRLAAAHHRDGDMPAIRAHQAAFARAVGARDALAMIATNRDFHAAIAEAGRNPYYTDLFCRLLDEGRRILRLYYSSFNDTLPRQYVDEHEEMITAILARDMARADHLGAAHADQIVRQIQACITADTRTNATLTL